MQIIKQIPNLITLSNLLGGCIAIVILVTGFLPTEYAFVCILYSLIADFLDGFTARLLKAHSPIGLQLDSLADMVSFGLFPGLLIFYSFGFFSNDPSTLEESPINYLAFLITLGSAYRLAKFNVDSEQTTYFRGLATPANTILCIGIFYLLSYLDHFDSFLPIYSTYFLAGFSIISCFLLVSNLPLFSLKFKSFKLKDLLAPILLALISIILLFYLGVVALAPIIILYIILSIIFKKSFVK
ncbi:CDP-alcohol phosphatidyltransferase family protein [Weeksellaceae bacterium TAE3-ERU29]|nr:CDP-alcohol phosphatidyltransferase family protein [Weeksellaceae bacterium TAE3-ERU29]